MGKAITYVAGDMIGACEFLQETEKRNNAHRRALFLCKCGKQFEAAIYSVRQNHTKSCGCHKIEANTKHGDSRSPIYVIWNGMKARCENPKSKDYSRYGAQGIRVCKEWLDYETFKKWAISNGFSHGLQIDRKDNYKGYSPDNCRIVTVLQQARNKKNSSVWTVNGNSYPTAKEASKAVGVSRPTVISRCSSSEYPEYTRIQA